MVVCLERWWTCQKNKVWEILRFIPSCSHIDPGSNKSQILYCWWENNPPSQVETLYGTEGGGWNRKKGWIKFHLRLITPENWGTPSSFFHHLLLFRVNFRLGLSLLCCVSFGLCDSLRKHKATCIIVPNAGFLTVWSWVYVCAAWWWKLNQDL